MRWPMILVHPHLLSRINQHLEHLMMPDINTGGLPQLFGIYVWSSTDCKPDDFTVVEKDYLVKQLVTPEEKLRWYEHVLRSG